MIKVIEHNAGGISRPDEPSLPIKLEMILRAPEFMGFAFVSLYGATENIVVRGSTLDEMKKWMVTKELTDHSRLSRFRITENSVVVQSHNW